MSKPVGNATLVARSDVTESLAIFRLRPEGGVPSFKAGQFITLAWPDPPEGGRPEWRAYSIASPPSCRGHVELYIRHVVEPVPGSFTTRLWELPIGGTLLHHGISGAFTPPELRPDGAPDRRTLLCVAGGTGIAPFVSMALDLRDRDVPREMVLIHGVSHVSELAYDDVLREMAAGMSSRDEARFRLRYVPTISRPQDPRNAGWGGATGRAESLLAREGALGGLVLAPASCFAMACGYEGTVRGVIDALEPRGFVTARHRHADGSFDIKVESYG